MAMDAADAMLREELTRSGAHSVRIETEDGGFIRGWTAWHVIRGGLGIEGRKMG